MRASNSGSGRSWRRDEQWTRQVGHSRLPTRRHLDMHSAQKRCRHSISVIVFRMMPRQMGQVSSTLSVRTWIVVVWSLSSSCSTIGSRWAS